jgi:hypothetical protein
LGPQSQLWKIVGFGVLHFQELALSNQPAR